MARAKTMIRRTEQKLRARLRDNIFAVDEGTMAETVVMLLRKKGLRLAVAESCPGGLLTHWVTTVPGSSDTLDRAFVTYSNRSKHELLGVPSRTLKLFGAVSRETAQAMAQGVRKRSRTDLGVAITGIAGPGGATKEKPVGLVYLALSGPGNEHQVWKCLFSGTRSEIQERSAQTALDHLRRELIKVKSKR